MALRVPADLEESIRQKVASGDYDDPSAVLRAAMRLLDQRDRRLQALRPSVAEGLASLARAKGASGRPN